MWLSVFVGLWISLLVSVCDRVLSMVVGLLLCVSSFCVFLILVWCSVLVCVCM